MPRYDAVIVGAGISGCAVAAMLAKSGKRVMISEPATSPGGGAAAFELAGHRISGWPLCSHGFEEGGAWDSVLHDLGLRHFVSTQEASYQVALPGRRVVVHPDADVTLEELRREYPEEIETLRRFYRDIGALKSRLHSSRISAYIAQRRRAGGFLRPYHFSKELLAFFSASSMAFFGRPVHDLSLTELTLLILTPPRTVTGGFEGIAREMCRLVTRQGGQCRLGDPWPELLVRRSRLEGLEAAGERIDVRAAVLNVPWQMGEWTLFSVIQEEVVPVGMLDTVLVVRDYERPEESLVVSLDVGTAKGTSTGGSRLLRAIFPHAAYQEATAKDLIDELSQVIPFLADFTEAVSLRDSRQREITVSASGARTPMRPASAIEIPLRLPIRTAYVLEDVPFGTVRQASAARVLAGKLV